MPPDRIKGVTLEVVRLEIGGLVHARRVRVDLGEPFELASTGERRRRLVMATEKSESRGLVEADISWDAVLAQVEMLLALESGDPGWGPLPPSGESAKGAAS